MGEFIRFLENRGFSSVEKLRGDASEREFYRLRKGSENFVLMKFSGQGLELQLRVHRFLSAILPLPRIYDVFPSWRAILMEDAGDLSLEEFVKKGGKWKPIYHQLLSLVKVLQTYGSGLLPSGHPVKTRALDRERFSKELNFTYQHFIKENSSVPETLWKEAFSELVSEIDYSRMVPNHRDLHSRNVFLKDGKILILDYQDCMMGPGPYDYASLLRDNYIYFSAAERRDFERELISENYILVSLQRHLKALGTFAYQIKKGKRYFSRYIPITLKYLREEIQGRALGLGSLIEREIFHRVYDD